VLSVFSVAKILQRFNGHDRKNFSHGKHGKHGLPDTRVTPPSVGRRALRTAFRSCGSWSHPF